MSSIESCTKPVSKSQFLILKIIGTKKEKSLEYKSKVGSNRHLRLYSFKLIESSTIKIRKLFRKSTICSTFPRSSTLTHSYKKIKNRP